MHGWEVGKDCRRSDSPASVLLCIERDVTNGEDSERLAGSQVIGERVAQKVAEASSEGRQLARLYQLAVGKPELIIDGANSGSAKTAHPFLE